MEPGHLWQKRHQQLVADLTTHLLIVPLDKLAAAGVTAEGNAAFPECERNTVCLRAAACSVISTLPLRSCYCFHDGGGNQNCKNEN